MLCYFVATWFTWQLVHRPFGAKIATLRFVDSRASRHIFPCVWCVNNAASAWPPVFSYHHFLDDR